MEYYVFFVQNLFQNRVLSLDSLLLLRIHKDIREHIDYRISIYYYKKKRIVERILVVRIFYEKFY